MSQPERLEVPKPLATAEAHMADGSSIVLRRHGNPRGPRLVISHCNGFAADAYYPFWSLLADRFDVVLFDLRNHGWNPVGRGEDHHVGTFVEDHATIGRAIDRHFGDKPKIGVFHSVSAQSALIHASRESAYSALVLFDPVVCPPGCRPEDVEKVDKVLGQLGQAALKRRERFASLEEFMERVLRSPGFQLLCPGAPELIAQATLRPAANGDGYELCCPREYEARVSLEGPRWARAADLSRVSCPVKIVGSDPTVPFSFLPTVDLREILALDYDFVPDTTHLLQLEQPAECVAAMMPFVERCVTEAF
ncbi:MAG: alpha/beta hydrolase [Holophagales bacterium]|nr:alpha/beta hydrolase [Holophagales bacterium]MYF95923.1 alpha/beta hydrolase [Holophagales bacterium]